MVNYNIIIFYTLFLLLSLGLAVYLNKKEVNSDKYLIIVTGIFIFIALALIFFSFPKNILSYYFLYIGVKNKGMLYLLTFLTSVTSFACYLVAKKHSRKSPDYLYYSILIFILLIMLPISSVALNIVSLFIILPIPFSLFVLRIKNIFIRYSYLIILFISYLALVTHTIGDKGYAYH